MKTEDETALAACRLALALIKSRWPREHGDPEVGRVWGALEAAIGETPDPAPLWGVYVSVNGGKPSLVTYYAEQGFAERMVDQLNRATKKGAVARVYSCAPVEESLARVLRAQ